MLQVCPRNGGPGRLCNGTAEDDGNARVRLNFFLLMLKNAQKEVVCGPANFVLSGLGLLN